MEKVTQLKQPPRLYFYSADILDAQHRVIGSTDGIVEVGQPFKVTDIIDVRDYVLFKVQEDSRTSMAASISLRTFNPV